MDTKDNTKVILKGPEEIYDLIALIGTVQQYMVSRVWRAKDDLICASGSVTRLSQIAGKYVGKDDPVVIVRGQHGLPAIAEILVPFMHTYLVEGWMRGSHWGPIMPVGLKDSKCTRLTARRELSLWVFKFQMARSHAMIMENRWLPICSMIRLSN